MQATLKRALILVRFCLDLTQREAVRPFRPLLLLVARVDVA